MHHHVHCSIFTIAKIMEQPKYPLMNEWIKKMWSIYTLKYYSAIKKWNLAICDNTDESWAHYAKWDKSDRKTSTVFYHLYVEY